MSSGNITGSGPVGESADFTGDVNVSLQGFGGENSGNVVYLERSFDAGVTWKRIPNARYTEDTEEVAYSAGSARYRLNAVSYIGGTTIAYVISQ